MIQPAGWQVSVLVSRKESKVHDVNNGDNPVLTIISKDPNYFPRTLMKSNKEFSAIITKSKNMKNLPALLFCMLFSLSAYPQTWKNYFSGNTIYHIDRLDSILLVGVDNQIVAINTNTGQTDFLMPPANNYGNCAPYRHVGIDADLNYWVAASAYANGLFNMKNHPGNSTPHPILHYLTLREICI